MTTPRIRSHATAPLIATAPVWPTDALSSHRSDRIPNGSRFPFWLLLQISMSRWLSSSSTRYSSGFLRSAARTRRGRGAMSDSRDSPSSRSLHTSTHCSSWSLSAPVQRYSTKVCAVISSPLKESSLVLHAVPSSPRTCVARAHGRFDGSRCCHSCPSSQGEDTTDDGEGGGSRRAGLVTLDTSTKELGSVGVTSTTKCFSPSSRSYS